MTDKSSELLAEMFGELMRKHFGATIVTIPAPTAEQLAEMEQRDAELRAMSDEDLIALWERGDETYCCDDIWAEGQRRGLGHRICI
jgi:hypothetical protein